MIGRVPKPKLARPPRVRLLGFGHTTDHLSLASKDVPDLPIPRRAAEQAYAMANLTPSALHAAEVHDCFSISEIVAYEILGFADPGQGTALLESGATALPSVREQFRAPHSALRIQNLPVNTSGGLKAKGHPLGATGAGQAVEAFEQLHGTAGARQVSGAEVALTHNVGGSGATCAVHVYRRG